MSKTWRILLAFLAVFALVASGCGNDDDAPVADTPSAPEETPDEPAPAPEPDDEDEPAPCS